MSSSILKWLSGSLILLIILSCKKQKGVLDDFPPGRFDFVYILNNSSNKDTIIGELSGPYLYSSNYRFIVRQELLTDKSLKSFTVGTYKSINNGYFAAQVNIDGTITYEDHDSDHLLVRFEAGDTLSGSLSLARKEY
ncbi:hypothetical protein D3C86_1392210 [compost metagenome]